MNNFKIIYKILKAIEQSMDYEEFDLDCISPETLGISEERWKTLIAELVANEYVKGITHIPLIGVPSGRIKIIKPTLTLKGMEYLEENSMMKKVANMTKGIIEIIK